MRVEANLAASPAEDLIDSGRTEKKAKAAREKLGEKDEHAGEKIKETADSVGIFGTIGSLLLGVLMWSQLSGLSGFLIGLVIAGAGVVASCLFVSLLYNYGDMITVSIEQAKALKRLEAERPKETPGTVKPETAQPELAQANLAVESEQETDSINEIEEEGIIPVEEHVVEGEKINQDLPLQAYEVDRVKRIAHFTRRSEEGVICPVCFKWQMPEDDKCFRCSCEFIYDNERRGRIA